VDVNIDQIIKNLKNNISACMEANSFDSTARRFGYPNRELVKMVSGVQVFKPVATMLIE
jgi:hypothetical protein